MKHIWGIDLGGTKIEGVIMDSDSSAVVERMRIDTESTKGYDHIVSQIKKLVEHLASKSNCPLPKKIGVGTPGISDLVTGLLKNSNTTCLNGRPLRKDLESILHFPIVMANDANCFALAEATLGAAKKYETVFGAILGTGVGGGIIVENKALNGFHGIAGEWGHNVIEEKGSPCYCGKKGCVETILAGPSLQKFYADKSGKELPLKEIVELARTKTDPCAEATLHRLISYFSKAISAVINILDPHAIVLGGGVGNIDELYTEQLRHEILKYTFNNNVYTPILRPALGDSAGVFGAALLVNF